MKKLLFNHFTVGAFLGAILSFFVSNPITLQSTLLGAGIGAFFLVVQKRGSKKNKNGIAARDLYTCKWCGKEYKRRDGYAKYCSKKCKARAKANGEYEY